MRGLHHIGEDLFFSHYLQVHFYCAKLRKKKETTKNIKEKNVEKIQD